jgi:hypothetical protein
MTNWDPTLPKKPENFPAQADLNLLPGEAQYLRERLQVSCTESLLTYLVENTSPVDETIPFIWLHPFVNTLPTRLQKRLVHARNFSESFHGAALLYNLMLAQLAKNEDRIAQYQEEMNTWISLLRARKGELLKWDRAEFWAQVIHPGVNIRSGTRRFIDEWLNLLLGQGHIANPQKDKAMRSLVEGREQRLKGGLSRFKNSRQLELWSGASFAGQIDYRWRIARRICNDILLGLSSGAGDQNAHTG